ncbi:MAG: glycosyltransferase family 2 protein [Candidatus Dormibacteria bacterium]
MYKTMIDTMSESGRSAQFQVRPGAYVLPLYRNRAGTLADLPSYLSGICREVDVIVVDGSPAEIFDQHARMFPECIRHLPVDPALTTQMGKVGGVMTGLNATHCERVVLADDDVRYDIATLRCVLARLDTAEVVRPQNYFVPRPWHALWDGARSLLNRALGGGDWPGTLAVRRRALLDAGGYRGDVMFENLEMVRTIRAAGGRESLAQDLYIARRPPSTAQFFEQRIRQAYDELARPRRALFFLSLLPAIAVAAAGGDWLLLLLCGLAAVAVAESGRRRDDGRRHFPAVVSLFAPLWMLERAVTMWLALGCRVVLGGIPYRGGRVRHAATSSRQLRQAQAARERVAA